MSNNEDLIRIGAGAGYAGDRIDPAVELAQYGDLDYLVFECLAERTIALAQLERLTHPERGYTPLLEDRMRAVLPYLRDARGKRRFQIITNMGAANPAGAAAKVVEIARHLGLRGLRVASVTGDDVLDRVRHGDHLMLDNGKTMTQIDHVLVSANAYLGAAGIVQALEQDADVIVTGRVADPALFAAPMIHRYGYAWTDWHLLGRAILAGHLLECSGQVTGGYFADPGFKDVEGLARLGFPIAEVSRSGDITLTKVLGSGGRITPQTCAEQLLYEVHDPACYLTPDVSADFSDVHFEEQAFDRVKVCGGSGHPKSGLLKVTVGYRDGYMGEGQMSYGGLGAEKRARLARDILLERLEFTGIAFNEIRADLIGVNSLYGDRLSHASGDPPEVRVRLAGRCDERRDAQRIADEVEALYTTGPASGGGAIKTVKEIIGVASLLLPEEQAPVAVALETVP